MPAGPTIAPIAAIYDPTLTLSTPARVSAETGMNALAHCVEVAWSPHRTPEAEAIALAGAARIVDALPRVVDEPDDLGARTDMLQGPILGRALPAERVDGRAPRPGPARRWAHRHPPRSGQRHRAAGRHGLQRRRRPRAPWPSWPTPSAWTTPPRRSAPCRRAVGLPARLGEVGVEEDDLEAVARLSQGNGSVQANPRPVSEDDAPSTCCARSTERQPSDG